MRAAIWQGPGEMALGEVPDATCAADGALLKVLACGICGTDVRTFFNGDRRIEPPWVLGHEITGEILELGPDAPDAAELQVGDVVHCISTLYCGHCRLCRSGNEHICLNGELMGFDYAGAYAELVAIPAIAMKNLFRVPEGLGATRTRRSPTRCPTRSAATRTSASASTRPSPSSAPGPVGTAHCALARAQGAAQVLLLEHAANRLTLSEEVLGRDRMAYVDVSDADGIRAVRDATDGFGADVVIVACSNDVAQEQAMEMAAPRGRVLFFGGLPKGKTHMRFPSNILHYQEVQVHGSYASRYRDQVQALDMLARDEGGIRGVVSEVVPARRRARAPSSASARARCSRSWSSPEPARRDAATTTTRRGDRRDPARGDRRGPLPPRRAPAVRARPGRPARRLPPDAARGLPAAARGGPGAARARLGHLRPRAAGAAQQPGAQLRRDVADRVVRPGAGRRGAQRGRGAGGRRRSPPRSASTPARR